MSFWGMCPDPGGPLGAAPCPLPRCLVRLEATRQEAAARRRGRTDPRAAYMRAVAEPAPAALEVAPETLPGHDGAAPTRSDHDGPGHIAAAAAPRPPRPGGWSAHAPASVTEAVRRPAPV
ncbi:hypothetical protein GCM10009576_096560 [Streptomyces rhizosphaericus]|uniref:Uncharacterized protein n=1 Tax=Streptomyces rhizosphaericus TaxID=114699 RepID=A0ABN1SSI7_9ACTN